VSRWSGASGLVFTRRLLPQSRADRAPTDFGVPVCRIGAKKPSAAITYFDLFGNVVLGVTEIISC